MATIFKTVFGIFLLIFLAYFTTTTTALAEQPQTTSTAQATIINLQQAYQDEVNAQKRYLAFAKKADEEGYQQVASLFRAAAESEKIHLNNHTKVLRELGTTPKLQDEKFEVKTTRENLETAIQGEIYDRDNMYPIFIQKARLDIIPSALRSFIMARAAEMEHAKFFQEALNNLNNWKTGKRDFYVCSVCGYTMATLPAERCPICFSPKKKFLKIS